MLSQGGKINRQQTYLPKEVFTESIVVFSDKVAGEVVVAAAAAGSSPSVRTLMSSSGYRN